MRKILLISLAASFMTGCASVPGAFKGSPLGDLMQSSNPNDYPSEFVKPSIEAGDKKNSIYGFMVGKKAKSLANFTLLERIRGLDVYKSKKNLKWVTGPIADRISAIYLAVDPMTKSVEVINVNYGNGSDIDSGWVLDKIKPLVLGNKNANYSDKIGEKHPKFATVTNYSNCRDKKIGILKSGIECLGSDVSVYRVQNGVGYMMDHQNVRFVVEGRVGLKNAIEIFSEASENSLQYTYGASGYKPKREVDNQGYVKDIKEFEGLKSNEYYIGAGLEVNLVSAETFRKKNKSELVSFDLLLTNKKRYGKSYDTSHVFSTLPRLKNTYLEGRDYYSKAIPSILNAELGCDFKTNLLPKTYSEVKRYVMEEVCDTSKYTYTLTLTEWEREGRGAIARESDYELSATLNVALK